MRLKSKALLTGALMIHYCLPASAQFGLGVERISDRFTTDALVTRTAAAYVDSSCLNYCITGIDIRAIVSVTGVTFIAVPVIAHNNPDLMVMTSRQIELGSYREWAALTAPVQIGLRQAILSLATGLATPADGGQTESSNYGEQQATSLYETEVVANPVALFSQLIGIDGEIINSESGYGDPSDPSAIDLGGIRDIASSGIDANAILQQVTGILDFADLFEQVQQIASAVSTVQAGLEGFGGADYQQDAFFCASQATALQPYYLSTVDAAAWRSGFPFVDAQHATQLASLDNFTRPSGALLIEDWGFVYPRIGYVDNNHSGRSAAVMTRRGMAMVSANAALRVRIEAPQATVFQKLSPEPSEFCSTNVADLSTALEDVDSYSYNAWVRYECVTSNRGTSVARIDIDDICF